MAIGQEINSIVAPSRITEATTEWKTVKRVWPNGRTTTKRMWATPRHLFRVEFDGISLAEFTALEAHFNEHSGSFEPFLFTDTHTDTSYFVHYDDDELDRRMVRRNTRGLYKLVVNLEEHKN